MHKFNTPVVMTTYTRYETTKELLSVLRKIAPTKVFIISDGPKAGEEIKVNKVRVLIENEIDWVCKVIKIYALKNLGLKNRIKTGLDEVFNQVDSAIILEDDCIPSTSFFYFCEELLVKYREETSVLSISGDNFLHNEMTIKNSYYFSSYFHSWGWATWKRAWGKYDSQLTGWSTKSLPTWFTSIFQSSKDRWYWAKIFDLVQANKINSWAYRWSYTHFKNNALSIVPAKNLVQNIGFGTKATNTFLRGKGMSERPNTMRFPLTHPREIVVNKQADIITARNIYTTTKNMIVVFIKKWLSFI